MAKTIPRHEILECIVCQTIIMDSDKTARNGYERFLLYSGKMTFKNNLFDVGRRRQRPNKCDDKIIFTHQF